MYSLEFMLLLGKWRDSSSSQLLDCAQIRPEAVIISSYRYHKEIRKEVSMTNYGIVNRLSNLRSRQKIASVKLFPAKSILS